MHAKPLVDRILRHISQGVPNVQLANVALLGTHFLIKNGRLPRSLSRKNAGFNDYIFWKAVGTWSEFERECVDKETAKNIARRLCPQIGIASLIDVLRINHMPFRIFREKIQQFRGMNAVAKPTHGAGAVIFLNDDLTDKELKNFYRASMISYFPLFREGQYYNLEKKVLIERNLGNTAHGGRSVDDYKFFCSRGTVFLCQINRDRFGDHRLVNVYVPDFVDSGVEYGTGRPATPIEKPARWNQFVEFAERLSARFEFVRIDLYDGVDGIYFGEFTFTPAAGLMQFSDPRFDAWLLQQLRPIQLVSTPSQAALHEPRDLPSILHNS